MMKPGLESLLLRIYGCFSFSLFSCWFFSLLSLNVNLQVQLFPRLSGLKRAFCSILFYNRPPLSGLGKKVRRRRMDILLYVRAYLVYNGVYTSNLFDSLGILRSWLKICVQLWRFFCCLAQIKFQIVKEIGCADRQTDTCPNLEIAFFEADFFPFFLSGMKNLLFERKKMFHFLAFF